MKWCRIHCEWPYGRLEYELVFGVVASPELQPLDRAIDDLQALDTGALHPHDIADLLVELRRETARLAAVEHALVEAVDRARPWAEANFLTTATWLAASDNTPLPAARRTVRTARRLGAMPVVRAALAAGDISAAHADRLAALNAPDVADAFAEAEEFLVGQARTMRWTDFMRATEYWLRHARQDIDPDPDARDRAHRQVHLSSGLRGTGILTGELTPAARTIIGTELERREQALFDLDWADARARLGDAATLADMARTPAQRRHDALVEMAQRSATAPADGQRPDLHHAFLATTGTTIGGGTTEIGRNILGERVLGLPGEPRTDKELPWSQVPRS